MASVTETHHHRNTTKRPHKPFKSRHSSKSSLKAIFKGKIEDGEKGRRRTPHQQVLSKLDRRNQAKQNQRKKHQEHIKSSNIFSGRGAAPKIVAVVPLCEDVNAQAAVESLNSSLDIQADVPSSGLVSVDVERFKQRLEYIIPQNHLIAVLDACRVADFVVLILSAEQEVETHGEHLLKAIESQGVSNVVTVIQGLETIQPPKRRAQTLSSLKSYINHFFPDQNKLISLDSRQECTNVIRLICTNIPKGIRWREDRSWMLVERVQWPAKKGAAEKQHDAKDSETEVVLTGVVRGKGLKADRLVQLADWGVFQIGKLTAAQSDIQHRTRKDGVNMKPELEEKILDQPTQEQDDLAELAPNDLIMDDVEDISVSQPNSHRKGVLLDDHHYFSDEELDVASPPKRLPKGTSAYQAAWLLDDDTDSSLDSDDEEIDQDGDYSMDRLDSGESSSAVHRAVSQKAETEIAPSELGPSEMFLDPSQDEEMEELAAFRSRQKRESQEDLEFPDEIELAPTVLARERLARYRGLKSLKTSVWETTEDKGHEPEDWHRLLAVKNYKASKNRVTREALVGGASPGTRVHVHLRNVPVAPRTNDTAQNPLCLYSLLRHEHKRTVINVSITLDSAYPLPLKSKEELILQCGPRRLIIHPLFSQLGQTPNNVHKYDRYLHPGRTGVATFIGPVIWGAVPALFFKRSNSTQAAQDGSCMDLSMQDPASTDDEPQLQLVGTGTCLPPDPDRVIAKRIILTGHPHKIHKNVVTVRYMFFNADDVRWFKALRLWTRRGRSGFIKESLGTHGYFKATFDGKINPQDAVCVSLYKRVFPRLASVWREEI
ncbi:MAG: hypothetical protein M1816_003418 [Peltula sp. TS41687]|nr:MAG: hypothetical protein M1816_003418 [Peltula sp. TS41687]